MYIWQHFFVNTKYIEYNRHFPSTYFLLDPFVLPYCFNCIRRELIYVLSIVECIHSTFCLTLGHHLGRIYYKSFVFAYYFYYFGSISSLMQIALNIIDIFCLLISSGSVFIAVLLVMYSVGIDLYIIYSCMYPYYFLPDFSLSSGEDLFPKVMKLLFLILLL